MSTISSKHEKRQGFFNPDLALVSAVLIGILVVLGAFPGDAYNSLLDSPGIPGSATGGVSSNYSSFALDEQYWNANCAHGWSSDSMCNDIVSRAQLCAADVTSAYCSDYEFYLQQYYDQKIINKDYRSL